jgi:MFS family permease
LYSLVSDYFEPKIRGKVYGILQLTAPLGYLLGMILGLLLSGMMGWRGIFVLTGSLGIVIAAVIFLFIKEAPRGQSEPEMQEITETINYHFEWSKVRDLLRNRTLLLVVAQGFFGVFPWNAITYWFFNYLQTERGYSSAETLGVMGLAVIILAAGYPLGGALGDAMFKRTPKGRLYIGLVGIFTGAILFATTLSIPVNEKTTFLVMMSLAAIFIPFASPNVISTVYDITLPEVRSTAVAVQSFLNSVGAALSPLMIGLIADASSLQKAFLWVCTVAWLICGIFFFMAARLVPIDIRNLRFEMQRRANLELDKR